ncbi:3-phenylpropionate-dihydrodiol/cinnamic acid-dihydrodiol dehydrogenase [Halalkalicoccus paucihalophilus]|uniref:3-phenylpropionate-dihydrodiol/cinnamic acid-dihydrodiol dehydrogenase n=1 Tax=Halalkalicoccus paucihalophilus TaxID=1008153 RepID=A0A151AJ35_9EURY|nr:SDR family oxidoreductase [Halalkalicoccus paucihalophilus]KYH27417.1 3-phenylpropionate-dihydrodiol/cinnamic acid-dihydrodiol dehydrogenase [Halalkalicoccus paucihalophilus]
MEKTVCITGCSSGIGRETAKQFVEEEWTVYATARDVGDIADLAELGCETAELDVTNDARIQAVVERIIEETGRLDCLVNNAGYGQLGPVEDVPVRDVERQFDTNVYGPHRLIREVLPHMRERGDGTVVNVSSLAGRVAFPGGGVYCGSKAALESMTDSLRVEADRFGVDVVLVEPGPVKTGFSNRATDSADDIPRSEEYSDIYSVIDDTNAIGGDGPGAIEPGEVADWIVHAASATRPNARYPVGKVAKLGSLARVLPDSLRDTAFKLALKIAG